MAPDLLTLSAIRHEETVHYTNNPPPYLTRSLPGIGSKIPSIQISVGEISSLFSDAMGNASEARTRALCSMYSTGFVFNQNQKNLVKALPWSGTTNTNATTRLASHNPVPSSSDMQRLVDSLVQGRGKGRKKMGDQQVQSLQSDRIRAEHAASMFALLT